MKRTIAWILALLMLAGCFPACADEYYWEPEAFWGWGYTVTPDAIREALQEAGRFAGNIDLYAKDHTGQVALTVARRDDASQMTILRQTEDGSWQVEACNDTIPFQSFIDTYTIWKLADTEEDPLPYENNHYILQEEQTYDGFFWMEMNHYTYPPDVSYVLDVQLMLLIRQDAEGWYIENFDLILYGNEDGLFQDKAPYYFISRNEAGQDGWIYEYLEWKRWTERNWECTKEPLYTTTLTDEEMMDRMRLDAFDYDAFVDYLRSITPDDLPHASDVVSPRYPLVMPGQTMPQTAGDTDAKTVTVYYNPEGGKYYHTTATCVAVAEQYWPLTSIPIEQLNTPNFSLLLPCPKCDPPERPPVPEAQETPDFVYYNPNGGRYYHAVDDCVSVSEQYLPLSPIPFDQLNTGEYSRLVPCPRCNPVNRFFP